MDSTTAVVTTGVIVTVGRWTEGKGLEANVVIGAAIYALFLSAIGSSQPKFAGQMATLTLVGALFIYAVPIAKKMGFADTPLLKTNPTKPTGPTQ